MGEHADDALEMCDFEEMRRLEFRLGSVSHADAYEEGIIDELGCEPSAFPMTWLLLTRQAAPVVRSWWKGHPISG